MERELDITAQELLDELAQKYAPKLRPGGITAGDLAASLGVSVQMAASILTREVAAGRLEVEIGAYEKRVYRKVSESETSG